MNVFGKLTDNVSALVSAKTPMDQMVRPLSASSTMTTRYRCTTSKGLVTPTAPACPTTQVDRATSELLLSSDWGANIEICDYISQGGSENARSFVKSIRRRCLVRQTAPAPLRAHLTSQQRPRRRAEAAPVARAGSRTKTRRSSSSASHSLVRLTPSLWRSSLSEAVLPQRPSSRTAAAMSTGRSGAKS